MRLLAIPKTGKRDRLLDTELRPVTVVLKREILNLTSQQGNLSRSRDNDFFYCAIG
ncbi:hypothetical protein IQ230_19910 [Gloeocapsopsis crepidinum LEGE 06123]|uniref:Uncharacterized protein n=1 Tax=Gloeocapsopsis crepidinum LEGE 06123 TaxID=588587 RepID=A0ABR9UW98_9CHRO|nr:hypothetical protein [Gloeocapsopsis crepidinum LEGE 06123]